jgi:hypothetical protein
MDGGQRETMKNRLRKAIQIAIPPSNLVLMLSAFDCAVFGNDSRMAATMKRALFVRDGLRFNYDSSSNRLLETGEAIEMFLT